MIKLFVKLKLCAWYLYTYKLVVVSYKKNISSHNEDTCRKAAYLGNGIVKSGIVNNSGLGDGRLCCHRVV